MKQPKLGDLKVDEAETKKIRANMAKRSSAKITINIDMDTLTKLRAVSSETGVPYQRLLNKLLQESLQKRNDTESRLDRLEKELRRIKRQLVA